MSLHDALLIEIHKQRVCFRNDVSKASNKFYHLQSHFILLVTGVSLIVAQLVAQLMW